jgi:hypothetical protein
MTEAAEDFAIWTEIDIRIDTYPQMMKALTKLLKDEPELKAMEEMLVKMASNRQHETNMSQRKEA